MKKMTAPLLEMQPQKQTDGEFPKGILRQKHILKSPSLFLQLFYESKSCLKNIAFHIFLHFILHFDPENKLRHYRCVLLL